MTPRLEGKAGLVTGGASGIGRALVERLVGEGADVAGDIDEGGRASLAATGCVVQRCDVSCEDDQRALADLALRSFGRLDVGVANAGAGHAAPLVEHQLSDWRRIIALCLTGTYLTVQAAARVVEPAGSITTIASLNAVQAARGMAAHGAAKAGVIVLSRAPA